MDPKTLLGFADEMEKLAKKEQKDKKLGLAGTGTGISMGMAGGGLGYSVMREHATGSGKAIRNTGKARKLGLVRLAKAVQDGRSSRHRYRTLSPKLERILSARPTRMKRLLKFEATLLKKHPSIAAATLATGAAGAGVGVAGGRWFAKQRRELDPKKKFAKAKKPVEPGPDQRAEEAHTAVMAGSLGLGIAALAGMFQPGGVTEHEMPRVATRLAKEMGLRNVPAIKTGPWYEPMFGFNAWFDQGGSVMGRHMNLPEKLRESVIGHEIGHALNDQAVRDAGPAVAIPYHFIQDVSRLGTPAMSALMTLKAAKDKDPSYKPGLATLAVAAPMLAEEAAASIRAGSHMIDKHGLQEGLVKSLPLVPAFATYATLAAAPLLVAAYRKHKREAAAKE